jgi:nucleoside-diphosphate-sugar epimerase
LIISSLYGRCEGQHRLINYIIKCVRSNKNLVLSSGNQVRQYINIEDVSSLLLKIIYEENLPGIYNLTSDNHTTINKIVEIVLSILNQTNYPISIKERADSNMKILMTCNKKIKKQFKWKPIIELEDGIKSYLNK